jgi:hypothetical protein
MVVVSLTISLFECHYQREAEHSDNRHAEDCGLQKLRTPYRDKYRYNRDEDEDGEGDSFYFLFVHFFCFCDCLWIGLCVVRFQSCFDEVKDFSFGTTRR